MERKIIFTGDGSHSISVPELNVTYHSMHGAIQESMHVFIEAGLRASGLFEWTGVHSILEMGFGTGLNALLSLAEADKHRCRLYYTAIDLYPLEQASIQQLNYCDQPGLTSYKSLFEKMHSVDWEEMYEITDSFRLTKRKCDLLSFKTDDLFDIIYFDAFAPSVQPELWTEQVFEKLYHLLKNQGILVTYSSKGDVRRAMQAAGFIIEKIPGPKGKREMVRARKVK